MAHFASSSNLTNTNKACEYLFAPLRCLFAPPRLLFVCSALRCGADAMRKEGHLTAPGPQTARLWARRGGEQLWGNLKEPYRILSLSKRNIAVLQSDPKEHRNVATASGNIRGVPDLLRVLSGIPLNRTHAHLRYWFRGQPKSGLPLQPGVYRSTFGSYANEEDRFTKEKHLNQDFKVLSAGLRTGRETDADIYFLQQHYRMPTRLLDWTTNPLAALYFACAGDEDEDGELFAIDVYRLSPIGIATSRHPQFTGAIAALVEWKKATQLPKCILAVRPDRC